MEVVGRTRMNLLPSATHRCSLKFTHPIPPLFCHHRRPTKLNPIHGPLKPHTLANAESGGPRQIYPLFVPLEGVIQFEKPDSNSFSDKLNKWGWVALLAGGDVAVLLLFSAIGRFSHVFSVFDPDTLPTADPFIAGWFLSAYFLGGFGEDGRGKNGLFKAFIAATKSWSLSIPVSLAIRAASVGHIPPANYIIVTMGSTAVLLIGWRTLLFSILPTDKSKKNDVYKSGSPFELFELLTSLVRRW
ncbi:hypothetical protein K7X08_002033 [Anisodus acutangulus]|uniref:Uncharacterized protein n=1 Tax=Anisodus acutangulus TaxID=402998 RepID=A0A9Q1LNP4_9SOLA|nr:hypothetical protein K7X08_002033 [Anisodus acutangulus]